MYMHTQFLFLLHFESCSPTNHSQAIPPFYPYIPRAWMNSGFPFYKYFRMSVYTSYTESIKTINIKKFMLVYLLDIYKVGTLLIHFHANRTASQQNTSPYIILWVKLGAYPTSARTIISHHALCITRELCWIQVSCIYYCKLTRVSGSISSP